jgi:cytochrome c-type biogenesis protein CcsB
MPVNQTLSDYSYILFCGAVVIYVIAMLLYFGEFAYGAPRNRTRVRESELVAVGENGSEPVTTDSTASSGIGHVTSTPPRRSFPDRMGGMAVAMTVLGVLVHAGSLILRGWAAHRVPWGNMYEFGSSISFAAMVAWVLVLARQARLAKESTPRQLRGLGGFVLLPVVILLFLSGTVLYTAAAPLQPALQSYWLWIHVSAAVISTGALIFAGITSVMYLLRAVHENNPLRLSRFGSRLPASQTLDRLAYRTTVFIMPVWTFAIIAGAIWAESAWGRYWGWDPKETCAFIAWVVYAAYLHARATAGWRGTRAAWINVLGMAAMLFNLFFVNLVVSGLHSYAGI